MAKRTANGLNEIRKLINVEEKYLDNTGVPTFDRSGNVTYVSGIQQGDGITDREGNSIKVQTFEMKYAVVMNAASTASVCRVLVVRDLQNQGATITAGDVLETVGVSTAPQSALDYTNGMLSNKRFSIIHDEFFTLDTYNPTYTAQFKSNHDCHVQFRGTTSAVASAGNGSYFVVLVSSETVNTPQAYWCTRMVYTDN